MCKIASSAVIAKQHILVIILYSKKLTHVLGKWKLVGVDGQKGSNISQKVLRRQISNIDMLLLSLNGKWCRDILA